MPVTAEHRGMAGRIDARMKQLDALGLLEVEILPEMADFMDEKLAFLCRHYPGLYRYGMLMEAAAETESKKAKTSYGHLPQLPESIKPMVAQLLTDGATLERGLQTILDERGRCDQWVEIEVMAGYYEHWMAQAAGLTDACRVARVHRESHAMMMRIFEPMAERINHLHDQVFAK